MVAVQVELDQWDKMTDPSQRQEIQATQAFYYSWILDSSRIPPLCRRRVFPAVHEHLFKNIERKTWYIFNFRNNIDLVYAQC